MSELKLVYKFGPFCLDPAEKVLLCANKPVHLTLKTFGVLQILVESHGHIIEKAELMRRCWPDAYVEEANLAQTICMLRKVLGDNRRSHHYVETISRRGYRFTADVVTGVLHSGNGESTHVHDDGEVHHLYKRGRHYWSKYTVEGLQKALDYFRRAINVDADHYLSYVGLADCYYRLSNIYLPPTEAIPKARSAVLKALDMNDQASEARALLALIRTFYDHEWPAAEEEFHRAIELAPDSPLPHRRYGWALGMMGRFNQGISEIDRAIVLQPQSPVSQVGSGIVHYLARDYDEAIARAKLALDLEPEFFPARVLLGMVLFQQDRFTEGLSEVKKAASLASVPWTLGYLGYGYGISGKRREALAVLTRLRRIARQIHVSPFATTLVLKGVGESAQALRSLLKTYEDRNELIGFALGSPELDDLRSDPRFTLMLRRSNFPPTHPAFIGARTV